MHTIRYSTTSTTRRNFTASYVLAYLLNLRYNCYHCETVNYKIPDCPELLIVTFSIPRSDKFMIAGIETSIRETGGMILHSNYHDLLDCYSSYFCDDIIYQSLLLEELQPKNRFLKDEKQSQ